MVCGSGKSPWKLFSFPFACCSDSGDIETVEAGKGILRETFSDIELGSFRLAT